MQNLKKQFLISEIRNLNESIDEIETKSLFFLKKKRFLSKSKGTVFYACVRPISLYHSLKLTEIQYIIIFLTKYNKKIISQSYIR